MKKSEIFSKRMSIIKETKSRRILSGSFAFLTFAGKNIYYHYAHYLTRTAYARPRKANP